MERKDRMGILLCLSVFVLSLGGAVVVYAEEEWDFLPSAPTFQKLIGDPREPQGAILAQTSRARFEGSVGLTYEFLQWRPGDGTRWGWGILAGTFIELDSLGANIYPERVSDWHVGMYWSQGAGELSHRLEFLHISSHLGDWLFDEVQRFVYTRESLRFTSSWRPDERIRLYGGMGYWNHIDPADRPFFLHFGTELYTGAFPFIAGTVGRGYFTYDLKVKDEAQGAVNHALQWGFQWKFKPEGSQAIRLALLHFNGNAEYGQFYRSKDRYWGVGLFFDP